MGTKLDDVLKKCIEGIDAMESIDRRTINIEKEHRHNMRCIKEYITTIYLPSQILLWSLSKNEWYLAPTIIISTIVFGVFLKILSNSIFYSDIRIEIYEDRISSVKSYKDNVKSALER